MKKYNIIVLLGVMLAFTGCEGIINSIKDTFDENSKEATNAKQEATQSTTKKASIDSKPEETLDFFEDTVALQQAENSLKSLPQFKGKKIKLYSDIHFYDDGRVSLSIQHPENQEYIDTYNYRDGAWGEPEPVQISIRTDLQSKLFELDKIKFKTVATIAKTYNEKAASLEGADHASHIYGVVIYGNFVWYPRSISGARMRYSIEFNQDGSLKLYKRE